MEPPREKTRGLRNNNPLNIERGQPWQGLRIVQTDPRFAQFTTMLYGLRAAFRLIRTYMLQYRLNTITAIIRRWAPPGENNTAAYIHTVSQRSHIPADQPLKFADRQHIVSIVAAMAYVESATILDESLLTRAYDLAK